jgi:hypothetical protein
MASPHVSERLAQILGTAQRLTIDPDQHVADHNAGGFRRTSSHDIEHQQAEDGLARQGDMHTPQAHTKHGALATALQEVLHGIARHREGQSPCHHTVDPDDMALRIGEWTSRVPRGEVKISLYPSLPVGPMSWVERVDDPDGQRPNDAQGMADRKDQIPDVQGAGITDRSAW